MKSSPPPASGHGTLPWTRSCFVCGIDNPHGLHLRSHFDGQVVTLRYRPRPADLGYRHIIHGGITGTLLDEVMTWSAILAAHRMCVAAEFTTRLKKPISLGMDLLFRAHVSRANSKLILTTGEVLTLSGELLGGADGKYLPMPPGQFALCQDDFIDDPTAIPLSSILSTPQAEPPYAPS
jgi:acyl-coenzyme A thioesterase PaaI-like protein